MNRRTHRWALFALCALAAVLASCGDDGDETADGAGTRSTAPAGGAPSGATVYPLTVDNCGTEVVIDAAPERVVVVDTSLAETLVALGLSDRVVGTYFDFDNAGIDPANRTALDRIPVLGDGGYPSREAVVALGPDLVFGFTDSDFEQDGAPTRDDLADAAIYRSEAFGCDEGEGSVESSFEEILELGAIFDRRAEARAIVDAQRARLAAVEEAVAGRERPRVVYWDAYEFETVRLLPFGVFQDAATRAGGDVLFADVTDASPVSKEQIATSDVDVVLAVDYGADTTAPLLAPMRELVAGTPAGRRNDGGVVPVTNYPPNLHAVSLVEAIASVLHPGIAIVGG